MSKSILSIIALLSIGSSFGQSPVIGLYEGTEYGETNNAYYKDTQDDLNKFIGTWTWSDNNSTLSIELRLREQELINLTDNDQYYTDVLIGEYVYTEAGQELINTIHLFESPFVSDFNHNIAGNNILDRVGPPYCDSCSSSERRVMVFFYDPNYPYIRNQAVLRHAFTGGEEVIQMSLWRTSVSYQDHTDPTAPAEISMPYGNYTLIKQ